MSTRKQGITLNELEFSILVKGGVVIKGTTAIILADIGFDRMERIIASAQVEFWKEQEEEWKKRRAKS